MHIGCNRCTCTIIETFPHLYWQLFIFSIDDCDGTGDHENYFKDITDAYEFNGDLNGIKYTNCRKKAVSYRSKYEHKPLSMLLENDFLLLNKKTGHYSYLLRQELRDNNEILNPEFSWVVINILISFLKVIRAVFERTFERIEFVFEGGIIRIDLICLNQFFLVYITFFSFVFFIN